MRRHRLPTQRKVEEPLKHVAREQKIEGLLALPGNVQ